MKFCISTGRWIAYERLLDLGTAILLRKPTSTVWVFNSKEQWVRASQSKRWRNTSCSPTRLSMSSSRLAPNA